MTTSSSSLPNLEMEGATTMSKLFDRETSTQIAYKANEVDAVVGYFLKRGFERIAAINTGSIILQQAAKDKIPVYQLLDTLKGLTDVQLSKVVAEILNINRSKVSQIGYKFEKTETTFDERNIIV